MTRVSSIIRHIRVKFVSLSNFIDTVGVQFKLGTNFFTLNIFVQHWFWSVCFLRMQLKWKPTRQQPLSIHALLMLKTCTDMHVISADPAFSPSDSPEIIQNINSLKIHQLIWKVWPESRLLTFPIFGAPFSFP